MIKEGKQYLAPDVKVFEIKERRAICTSPTGGSIYSGGEEDDLG